MNKSQVFKTAINSFLHVFFMHLGTFFVTISITRILSVDDYGIISLANSLIFFLIIVFSAGIPNSLARFLVEYDSRDYFHRLILRSISIFIPWSILIIIIYLISFPIISSNIFENAFLNDYKHIIILIVIISILRLFIEKISHGTLNMEIAAKMGMLTAILMLFVIPTAILYNSAYSVLIAKSICLSIPLLYAVPKLVTKIKKNTNEKKTYILPKKVEILKYGLPLSIISIAGFGFLQADILLLSFYVDSKSIAYYSIAIFLYMRLVTIPRSLGNGLGPFIAKNKDNTNKITIYYQRSILLTVAFVVPVVLFLIFNGKTFLIFLFGKNYENSYSVLSILSIFFILSSCLGIINPILDFSGKANLRAKAVIIGSILNIFLDLILIPKYGIDGAAYATVIGYFFFFLIIFLSLENKILIHIIKYKELNILLFFSIFILIPLLILSTNYLTFSIYVNNLIIFIFYPFLIYALKIFNKEDLKIFL